MIHQIIKELPNKEEKFIKVKIRLDDECNNGHNDFSITGETKFTGGCIHEEIIKHFPEFQIFIDLHLCDQAGVHMYIAENGFYHLKEMGEQEFIEYYDFTEKEYDSLKLSDTQEEFKYMMETKTKYFERRKAKAQKAIWILEKYCDCSYIMREQVGHYTPLKKDILTLYKKREENGYFEPSNAQKRKEEKEAQQLADVKDKIKKDAEERIKKEETDMKMKLYLLEKGGEKFLNNCIYYSHTNTLNFNWKSFEEKISEKEILDFARNHGISGFTYADDGKTLVTL